MQPSIALQRDARQQYLLRLGDTCLISAQRLGEWTGHAPVLEEDIALANMALDLLGQARAVLTLAGSAQGLSEDQLAFLREERDYFNPTLVELPNGEGRPGDFALTVLRNAFVATLLRLLWERLQGSADEELAAIAAKAVKEARYHQQHAADWVLRLGDGTDESHRRMQAALDKLWPYTAELFDADAVDDEAADSGLGPRWAELRGAWMAEIGPLLQAATLRQPPDQAFMSTGRRGVHSEHMGYILAEMQHLQRAYPGGAW
ncbi:1,2-phenylacetyl-CoA epoxidase subunit PaaC [Azohydromonas lata]|uniref:1,2-phenylacetyl-CoA epoxidase subunit PaaC n=1 Tax=Azohydromonas lata TaxID=45677 RepID=A0ABU5IAU4_9BURK|nr:1,2-phenylacetyl-CoA epoxidase subunit PaaC [Azohydromonas lata]MDZ5456052.1 1,2-phenylacetyl-CoA epoxidase subunit PaaC [Azohydromonas lata]